MTTSTSPRETIHAMSEALKILLKRFGAKCVENLNTFSVKDIDAIEQAGAALTLAKTVSKQTVPPQAQAQGETKRYRLLQSGLDRIEPTDEFLSDDTTHWAVDPNATFAGMIYGGSALRPARRAKLASAPEAQ